MNYIFEIFDKNGRKVHLTLERLKHIQKHPHMNDPVENIKLVLQKPLTIRYEEDEEALYFYKEFKEIDIFERYLLVSVKYLNGEGFVITSFFTNRITGEIWKEKWIFIMMQKEIS